MLLHEETLGRSENTLGVWKRLLKLLNDRADLNNTEETNRAINKYIKKNGQKASNAAKIQMVTAYSRT